MIVSVSHGSCSSEDGVVTVIGAVAELWPGQYGRVIDVTDATKVSDASSSSRT